MFEFFLHRIFKVKAKSVYLRDIYIQLQRAQKKRSYSYTCDLEINRLATPDYGQRWLVLNPIPNNKHQENKNSHVTQTV